MNLTAPARLAAYAIGLAGAFATAFAVGGSLQPVVDQGEATPAASSRQGADAEQPAQHDAMMAGPTVAPAGLAVSQDGFTLVPGSATLPAGTAVPFAFTVTGPEGDVVTDYLEEHEKELHLVVVRRDLAGFQHVHPTRDDAGTWSVPLDLSAAGTYRVFADFVPTGLGRGVTLGTDVFVGGDYTPQALPAPSDTATVEGYEVTLDGVAAAGQETELTFTVRKDGEEVTDLEPYLGAFGHLVALRAGDLAYLHTHPSQEARSGEQGGPAVEFATEFPTAGAYRLFLDFRHAGQVRTAELTVEVLPGAGPAAPQPTAGHDSTQPDH
ncbi:MAG: hypothetical protein ACLGIV_06925 [Actinomycetes bacterium]